MNAVTADGRRRAGLLHTVPALAGVFQSSIERTVPGVRLVHVADPWLLSTAVATGVGDEVRLRVVEHVRHLVATGAEAVLVTCSSIGEAAEAAASDVDVPVLRVDAPMAAEAVRLADEAGARLGRPGRIAVLATLSATLGPTGRLIQRSADAASSAATMTADVVQGAVAAREAGDTGGHDSLIADAVAGAAGTADVVVLAQASMARAIDGATQPVPVLTSPDGGVAALARALG